MKHLDRNDERVAKQLLSELSQRPVAVSTSSERESLRARLLPVLRERVQQVPLRSARRRARREHTLWAFAAAAVLVAGVGVSAWLREDARSLVLHPQSNAVEWLDHGRHRTVTASESIAASGQLDTRENAALTTAEGVRVELSALTRVGLDELNASSGWRLRLHRGQVACEVPKLTGKKSFSVVTPDAEVIVHGTRFTVATDGSTCVRVSEGRVEVRSNGAQTFLTSGQQWGCVEASKPGVVDASPVESISLGPTSPPSVATAATAPRLERRGMSARAEADKSAQVQSVTSVGGSTLALESELVARALSAERRGEVNTARELYLQFLERYPQSPMAPEARRGLGRAAAPR
jgi:FecR protein